MEIFSPDNLTIFLRLAVAMLLGGVIGIERSVAGKVAGARTFALISFGAALFVSISELVGQNYLASGVNFDPLRMATQIVVGIGFVGAGIIFFKEPRVEGATTAAGLWVAAAAGTAVGHGFYAIPAFAAILTLFVFAIVRRWEESIEAKFRHEQKRK